MAQYIALIATAMSVLAPTSKNKNSNTGTSSSNNNTKGILTLGSGNNSASFSSGIVTGLALAFVVISQYQKYRIKERIRYSFLQSLKNDDDTEENVEEEIKQQNIHIGEEAIMEIITNCNNSISPNLHCSKITLKKGTTVTKQASKGVEIYYILYGCVNFIVNDNEESLVKIHETKMIQPWTSRVIINNSNDDVVFLRISDAGNDETKNNANLIVEKIDHSHSTLQVITEGLKSSIKSIYG